MVYLVKSGVCQLMSAKMPLGSGKLGVAQGNMSKTFREFQFGEIGPGEWAAEESVWSSLPISYSLVAKTDLIVLEIASSDLRRILTHRYHSHLEQINFQKHRLLLERASEIEDAAEGVYNST